MKRSARRILFWLMVAGYVAGCAWWLLTVPRNSARVLACVPGHATIVTRHDQLAVRWDDVSQNTMVKVLAGALGVDAADWEGLRKDEGFRTFINLVGRDEVLLAYVPDLNDQSQGHWIMASWIGGMSQRLRWSHRWLDIPGLERVRDVGGWPVWKWRWRNDGGEQEITIVLVEGILLATTGRDAQSVQILVDAYNGNFPSMTDRPDRKTLMQQLATAESGDSGWYTPPSISGSDYWLAELNLSGTNQLRGSVRTPKPAQYTTPAIDPDWNTLSGLWSGVPLAVVVAGLDAVLLTLDQQQRTKPLLLMREMILRSGAETVALALFGGEFSGRLKGIKIPALMAGLQAREPLDLATFIPMLIDRWNATHKLGLVAVPQQVGTATVWRVEGTAGGIYGGLSSSEQVAITAAGPWIVISSNFGTLEKLLVSGGLSNPAVKPLLLDMENLVEGSIACAGFDLVRSTEAFRLALSAYSLKLLYEDSRGSRARREKISEAKAWLESLALMKNLRVRASAETDIFQLDFEAGPGGE